jgi:hypothetical protein
VRFDADFSDFRVDATAPSAPGDLGLASTTDNSVTLRFGSSTDEVNFSEYKIFYKEGTGMVSENDSPHTSSTDANLGLIDYNGAGKTTITSLGGSDYYVFNIWAYDEAGNKASATSRLIVDMRYRSESQNWQWFYDEDNETPTSSAAAENVTPSSLAPGDIIKLRWGFNDVRGITGENVKFRLQYSKYSDFSQDVYFVGESASSSDWVYADGAGIDDNLLSNLLLSNTNEYGSHNESGISTSSVTHASGTVAEWEFTIQNNSAQSGQTYYFRAFNVDNNEVVNKNGESYSFPSIIPGDASLSFNISGLPSGTSTEGVITNISASSTGVDFGTLSPGEEKIGAQRININTNAGNGYSLFVYERSNMISAGGSVIQPVSSTNESPAGWPIDPDPSAFGYHTGDETLSSGNKVRFSAPNTYARFEQNMKEVGYNPTPTGDEFDLIYRSEIEVGQEAGDYASDIVYILVPEF